MFGGPVAGSSREREHRNHPPNGSLGISGHQRLSSEEYDEQCPSVGPQPRSRAVVASLAVPRTRILIEFYQLTKQFPRFQAWGGFIMNVRGISRFLTAISSITVSAQAIGVWFT